MPDSPATAAKKKKKKAAGGKGLKKRTSQVGASCGDGAARFQSACIAGSPLTGARWRRKGACYGGSLYRDLGGLTDLSELDRPQEN